jgi:curved DNA-binding protein
MMDYRDYYATLGVKRDASQAEIKRAFRKLARQHHPDVKPGDRAAEAKFKEINEANEVLSDPQKRSKYDSLGANWEALSKAGAGRTGGAGRRAGSAGDPFGPGSPFAGFGGTGGAGGQSGGVHYEFRTTGDGDGFSDFFRTFFGAAAGEGPASPASGGRGSRPVGGASFEDILAGLNLDGGQAQRAGGGNSNPARGQVTSEADVELSLEEAFHGTSRLLDLDGKRLEVAVPRGVETGSRIRLRGKGAGGGDLDLVTRVRPHPTFGRKGADLTRELPLTLGEALLGAEVPVATLKGKVLLKIPAGTQNGRTFRLTGQGMPRLKPKDGVKPTGDLLVTVRVVLPSNLSDEARQAATTFIDLVEQPDPRASTK